MKKVISVLLVILILLSAAGCSSGLKNASEKAISVAKQAVELADGYLDGKIPASEAWKKAKSLSEEMAYVEKMEDSTQQKEADATIADHVYRVYFTIMTDTAGSNPDRYQAVIDARNTLARDIGQRER